jgi:hypothetical protein
VSGHALEQQVNLYQPILGAERRLFSARAIGVALTVLAACLVGLASYGSWRTHRIEHSIDLLAQREAANVAMAERANLAVRPTLSMAQLDAEAKDLGADIDARQRALDIVQRSSATPATGFAARLEALARRQLDGVWLSTVIVGSGEGLLAMRGGTTDARLLPAYLAALAGENALGGVRFEKIAMHHASPKESPAQVIFQLDGPGLSIPPAERSK